MHNHYRVPTGYNARTGRTRYRRFATLQDAVAFCSVVFRRKGVVLAIERMTPRAS